MPTLPGRSSGSDWAGAGGAGVGAAGAGALDDSSGGDRSHPASGTKATNRWSSTGRMPF